MPLVYTFPSWILVTFHRYEVFHKDQMDIVKNYPMMVRDELKDYDEGVCKFFEVGRNQPVVGHSYKN